MNELNPTIVKYIETEIIPRYGKAAGHRDSHISQVITRSLGFAKRINSGEIKDKDFKGKINLDMCYVVAAFHDLGRLVDDETHEKISAKILKEDQKLPEFFSPSEIQTMAEAVEDHRASNRHEPRSVYGRIVSSADRNTKVNVMLKRCYEKVRADFPDETEDEIIERVRVILRKKYGGHAGYAAKKMYFPDPDFEKALTEIERVTRDFKTFRKLYDNPAA